MLPRPPLSPRIYSSSCPLSWRCYLILFLLLLLSPIFPSVRVFPNELAVFIKWPKYWSFSFSFSISPSNEYSGLISFSIDWLISLQFKGLSRVFSSTTIWKHQFFGAQAFLMVQLSHLYLITEKVIALTIRTLVYVVTSLLFFFFFLSILYFF